VQLGQKILFTCFSGNLPSHACLQGMTVEYLVFYSGCWVWFWPLDYSARCCCSKHFIALRLGYRGGMLLHCTRAIKLPANAHL